MRRKYLHTSITGNTATTLIRQDRNRDLDIQSMTVCNTHASDTLTLDLFLSKLNFATGEVGDDGDWNERTDTYTTVYLLRDVALDATNTLVLESNEIEYDGTQFELKGQLNNSDSSADIIINFKKRR
jgi:hypothetical protein